MTRLLMITGLGSAKSLATGQRGAFHNMLEEFSQYWDRVDIICPRVESRESRVESLFGNVYLHISPWPLVLHPFWFLKKALELHKVQKFDLITVHEFPPFYNGIGARLLWNMIKVPYILEIMHVPGYPKAASLKEAFYKDLMRLFIRHDAVKSKAVRVINQNETPKFLIRAGIPSEKIKYIPAFYIDLDIFKKVDLRPGEDKKYDLVFAARLEKNKGILNLVKAVKVLKAEDPTIKLLIIGNGLLKPSLTRYVINNDLENNVDFSGWLEGPRDVAAAYNSAKVMVNPSFNEGGPRVVLEAMACGLPVITTKVGLMIDIIRDGENGLFVGWDPKDIATKIRLLLRDHNLRAKFSNEGLMLVKRFERKSAIKNYADSLKSVWTLGPK